MRLNGLCESQTREVKGLRSKCIVHVTRCCCCGGGAFFSIFMTAIMNIENVSIHQCEYACARACLCSGSISFNLCNQRRLDISLSLPSFILLFCYVYVAPLKSRGHRPNGDYRKCNRSDDFLFVFITIINSLTDS